MRSLILLLAARALLPGLSRAAESQPMGFIETSELVAKTSKPRSEWHFTLIDARTRVEFENEHIPGAINIPARLVPSRLARLVKDERRELIFYCNGPKCTKSKKAAVTAIGIGYTNVLEYNEGLPAWIDAKQKTEGSALPSVDVPLIGRNELLKLLRDKGVRPFLVDVRDPDEFPGFHLAGSVNIPLDDIERRFNEFPGDRLIMIVDHAGHQTLLAGRLLSRLGRKDVKRLDDGLFGWRRAGLPLEHSSNPR